LLVDARPAPGELAQDTDALPEGRGLRLEDDPLGQGCLDAGHGVERPHVSDIASGVLHQWDSGAAHDLLEVAQRLFGEGWTGHRQSAHHRART